MKFVLEERDKELVEDINNNTDGILLMNKKGKYFIEFEVHDIAKGNMFVFNLMSPNSERVKELKDLFGIEITRFHYSNPRELQLDQLKCILRETLNSLEHLES